MIIIFIYITANKINAIQPSNSPNRESNIKQPIIYTHDIKIVSMAQNLTDLNVFDLSQFSKATWLLLGIFSSKTLCFYQLCDGT